MIRTVEIRIAPELLGDESLQRELVAKKLQLRASELRRMVLVRRSLDSRGRTPLYVLRFQVWIGEPYRAPAPFCLQLRGVHAAPEAIVVGFGPAGMFAALKLIELGIKPVILERGKEVRPRRRDLAAITKRGEVNPDSNYCFGEGGAGTFSDGKLYTRSTKRGSVERILQILVLHGADPEILIDAHPHIGTNKLPQLVQSVRQAILEHGGELHFGARAERLVYSGGKITGVQAASGAVFRAPAVILATGHSARDVFSMLVSDGIHVEHKPFALGVRVEHPQVRIDQIQYGAAGRGELLPPAAYSLTAQTGGRGVFSFCMCPGGIICPAATSSDEIVVNGWSPSKRNSPFANSGIVVEVKEEDLAPFAESGALAGVELQRSLEQRAHLLGGGGQTAPAQRLTDFLRTRRSASLPPCSYLAGVSSVELGELFPPQFHRRLIDAFTAYGRERKGFVTEEAVVVAVESRTSSPVRIPRDRSSRMHPALAGLFPAGEGAGYAGGIMSAAMDGEASAEAVARYLILHSRWKAGLTPLRGTLS